MTSLQLSLLRDLIHNDQEYRKQWVVWHEKGNRIQDFPNSAMRNVEVGRMSNYRSKATWQALIELGLAEFDPDSELRVLRLVDLTNKN